MKRWVRLLGLMLLGLFLASNARVRGESPKPLEPIYTVYASSTPMPNVHVRFEGPVSAIPEGLVGTWTIANTQVIVPSPDVILPAGVDPAVGDRALVRAFYTTAGDLQAVHVTITQAAQYRPELVELSGIIQPPLPDDLLGEWLVNGVRIVVNSSTSILPAGVRPGVGDLAHVNALRQFDGRLLAQSVVVESAAANATRVQFEGAIQQYPNTSPYVGDWQIAGVRVQVNSPLAVTGQPNVGLTAEVDALANNDGTVVAERIQVVASNARLVDLEGTIQALPESGLVGTWVIGGKPVNVLAATLVDESRAPAQIGQWAVVRALQTGDTLDATRIRIERPRDDKPAIDFSGLIQSLPETPALGAWKVGGVTVDVDSQTQIHGVPTTGQGAVARVLGKQQTNGHVQASDITITYPWATEVTLQGTIQQIPATFFGTWQIAGANTPTVAWVTPWAAVSGAPKPGAALTLRGVALPTNGTNSNSNLVLALSVEVPGAATTTQHAGTVESAAWGGLGAWQVDGQTVFVNASTQFVGQPQVGSLVSVTGTLVYTGSQSTSDRPQILAQSIAVTEASQP